LASFVFDRSTNVNRVLRSTSVIKFPVPFAPLIRSPSQCPTVARVSTSGGRVSIIRWFGICPRRPPSSRGQRRDRFRCARGRFFHNSPPPLASGWKHGPNIEGRHPVLQIDELAEDLAKSLIEEGAIPENKPEDALHIALAARDGIDYLLTWNFTHIHNAQMELCIRRIVEHFGYQCPVFCAPDELMGE